MASYKQIPNLPLAINLAGNELLEGVQAGTSVRFTTGQVIALGSSTGVNYITRAPSLNLLDFMFGDVYVNDAFVRIQTALLEQNLRGIYVPGDRTYLLDPAKQEIQLVVDDLTVWGENDPEFFSTRPEYGAFQVLYAHRVKIEGVRIVLDPSLVRENITGGYAGDKYNGRRSAIGLYDSDDFWLDKVFTRNWCGGWIGKGYHTSTPLNAWKALSPAQRVVTPMNLTSVNSMGDFPDLPSSARRAGGKTRLFGLRSEHCDFAILYHSIENMRIDDFECKDTTVTAAHPHAIYAAGNITSNVMKYDELGNPIGLADPTKPPWVVLKDKSNGTCKATNLRDYDNPYAPSFKFRVHDQVTVMDAYSQNAGGGLTFNNSDGAFLDGAVVQDCHAGLDGDLEDDDGDDPKNSVGLTISGCRDGIFQNVTIYLEGGTPDVSPVYCTDTHGSNQRINPTTGELICSRNNRVKNIFVKTNYANGDQNRDYDIPPFDPTGIAIKPIFQIGDDNDSLGTGWHLEDCKHVDAYGYTPTEMFYLKSGSGHRIVTPTRKGTGYLARVHQDCTDNLIVIDPDLVESRMIRHDPLPLPGNDYTRVHVIRSIKGDNAAYLADFGPLDTGLNVAETMNRAALIVGRRGPGTIHMPSGDVPVGPFEPIQISPTEGTTIIMTAAMSNITWQGHATVMKPISNRISIFEVNGATNTKIKGIKFDNSEHGILKFEDGGANAPGGGVAANGNSANSAIYQWTGANVQVDDCEFVQIHTGFQYKGNYLNIAQRVGTADIQNCRFDGVAMGFLPSQPEHVICNGNSWLNGTDSLQSGHVVAPGHLLYITNRPGAEPWTVTANNNYARHCASSVLKLRKGYTQVCIGNDFMDVHRGIESHNARNVTITGNTIKVIKWPTNRIPREGDETQGYPGGTDGSQSAIMVTGCYGGGVIANNTLERSGSYGWVIRISPQDVADDTDGIIGDGEYPRNLHVHHNKIVDDCSSAMIQNGPVSPGVTPPPEVLAPLKPWIYVDHLTDGDVSDNTLHILEHVDTTEYMVHALNCVRTRFFNNARHTASAGTPLGSDLVVKLEDSCVDCTTGFQQEDIDVVATDSTILDNAASTKRVRTDGAVQENFVPVVSFTTNGSFVPVMGAATGWIVRRGDVVDMGLRVLFDTNNYATPSPASGTFRVSFPYKARTYGIPFVAPVASHKNIVAGGDNLGVVLADGDDRFSFRRNTAGGAGVALDTSNFPVSTVGFDLSFQMSFRIARMTPWARVPIAETQALINAGWVPTNDAVLHKVDTCIQQLKIFGLWTKILAMWGPNSLLNWKNPGTYTLTAVGTPTFVVNDYFAGGGTDANYYNTTLDLLTMGAGVFTQNAASLWRWSKTNFAGDSSADLGMANGTHLQGRTAAGSFMKSRANSGTVINNVVPDSLGLAGWSRSDANTVATFKNGLILSTSTSNASGPVQAGTFKIGRAEGGNASSRHMAFAGVGGTLTTTDIRNLYTTLDYYLSQV